MARYISNINSSLKKRRRLGISKRIGIWAIFILFFISLFILGLTWQKVRIQSVSILGNSSVSDKEISNIVEKDLSDRYLWIIPTDNWLLIQKSKIRNEILQSIPKIHSVLISFDSLNSINVSVAERVAEYVWCSNKTSSYKKCYFMDENGFIFGYAPDFSGNLFPEFFGLIQKENPVGESYFDSKKFSEISQFFSALNAMQFNPVSFNAVDEHEYEVYLSGGGKIIANDEKTFTKDIENLQAVIDNGYIKIDPDSLKKIKYIDLRFGNKVVLL